MIWFIWFLWSLFWLRILFEIKNDLGNAIFCSFMSTLTNQFIRSNRFQWFISEYNWFIATFSVFYWNQNEIGCKKLKNLWFKQKRWKFYFYQQGWSDLNQSQKGHLNQSHLGSQLMNFCVFYLKMKIYSSIKNTL